MIEKLKKIWNSVPKTVRVGGWIGVSAAISAVGSFVLKQPELVKYYGVVNLILYFIKELNEKIRKNE